VTVEFHNSFVISNLLLNVDMKFFCFSSSIQQTVYLDKITSVVFAHFRGFGFVLSGASPKIRSNEKSLTAAVSKQQCWLQHSSSEYKSFTLERSSLTLW